jgi:hypothetical protein
MQMLLIQNKEVVQAFSPHTPEKTLTCCIGSWSLIGRFEDLDCTRCCNTSEAWPKLAIVITYEILGHLFIWSRFPQRYALPKDQWEIG